MIVKDLYKVMDAWTNITVEDLDDEEEVYDGLKAARRAPQFSKR